MTLRAYDGTAWVQVPAGTAADRMVCQSDTPTDTGVLWDDEPNARPVGDELRRAHARHALISKAWQALEADRDYLALPSPSNAQMAAHLRELTRQNIGLIRLVLGDLDGTN